MATLVDTNVLLRLLQPNHPQNLVADAALAKLQKRQTDLCVAPQNLVECWVVATRPVANNGIGLSAERIAGEIRSIQRLFRPLEGKAEIIRAWESLVSTSRIYGKLSHDAHLVATTQLHTVADILTFDLADSKRFPGISVVDPFQFWVEDR